MCNGERVIAVRYDDNKICPHIAYGKQLENYLTIL